MRHPSLRVLALSLALGSAGAAEAKSTTTDNLTVFSGTKALSPEQVLRDNAERYGLPRSLDNLVLVEVQESLLGKHYRYQQMLLDLPVDTAQIVVSIGKNGQLLQIFNETRHVSAEMDDDAVNQLHLKQQLSSEAALDQAWTNMRVQQPLVDLPKSELVWLPVKGGFQLVHKVTIAAEMPTGGFVQYLNAQDGRLVDSYSTSLPRNGKFEDRTLLSRFFVLGPPLDRKAATAAVEQKLRSASPTLSAGLASGINGSGYVFDPDPRTTLNTDGLTDTSAASAFDAAYSTQPLRDITLVNGVYSLSGPYINIKDIESPNIAPSTTTNGIWTAKRGNDAFDDTNVYFHIDQSQRYIQSLGFTNIINRPMNVDTNGVNGDDNSHYSRGTSDYLAFGHGCVNDSEDADVILHEYGHGIQANINSSWSGGDTGAMGEGFGDYWAGSYSYITPNGATYHPEWVFSWDGHSTCWSGRMLNRTDAKYNASKTYSAHQSVTEGGVTFQSDELWSAPLFESLKSLMAAGKPRENVDKIILQAHFGLGSGVRMPAMATAIVNAAHNLFPTDPTYENTFNAKFQAQGILGTVVSGPTISETESNNTTATANVISTANTTVNATISASSDVDYFKVSLPAGKTLTATMTPNATSDYDLYLYNSSGTQLASSVKGTGAVDVVTRANTGTTAMVLYVKVIYYSGGTGATNGKYALLAGW
jgi:hypothetical protein